MIYYFFPSFLFHIFFSVAFFSHLITAIVNIFFFSFLISPDQSFEILCDYAQQCTLGRKVQIHTVTYDCSNPASLVSNCVHT